MSCLTNNSLPKNNQSALSEKKASNTLYIAIDGDDVGRKLEYYIVTNQVVELSEFFQRYQQSMIWLESQLSTLFDANIVINGGDSLLAFCNSEKQIIQDLELIKKEFSLRTDSTLSIGLGNNPRQAYFALKLAKASGKNRIDIFEEC